MVTVAAADMSEADLRAEVVKLRSRVRTLSAVLGLLVAVLRVSERRMPRLDVIRDRTARAKLLSTASRARRVLPTSAVLEILGISSSRYTAWVRAQQGCDLDDRAACPRSTPTPLTPDEMRTIHSMVTSEASLIKVVFRGHEWATVEATVAEHSKCDSSET